MIMTQVIAANRQTPANSATVAPGSLRPVAPEERIGALHLPRGWAMFGVLWSNLNDVYARHTALDDSLILCCSTAVGWVGTGAWVSQELLN